MRLTSLAAGIFTLALAGYIGVTTEAPAKGAAQPIPHARANQPISGPAIQPTESAASSGAGSSESSNQRRQRVRHSAQ